MAEEQQKKGSELEKWRKRCCYCCAFGVLLGMMLLAAGDNKTEEGKTPGEYESVEDCLDELFSGNSNLGGNCHYDGPNLTGAKAADRSMLDKMTRFLSSKGTKPIAIAAVLGNMTVETGNLNQSACSAVEGNGEGHGLVQWSYGRKDALFALANQKGKPWSGCDLQLDYLWQELTGSYKTVWANVQKQTNIEQATEIFMDDFESPDERPEVNRIDLRKEYAKLILKNIKCSSSSDSSSSTSSSGKNNISIPYYNQCDTNYATAANDLCGNGCGKTSVAMVASYITKKTIAPNQIATYSLESELATFTGKPTKAEKIASTDKTEDITKKIEQQINKGNPVIIGTGFSTGYGHIMVVRGYDGSNYKINDPAGDHGNIWTTAYSSNNGNNVSYNKNDVVKHLTEYPYTYLNQGSWLLYVDGFTGPTNGGKQCLEGESTKYPGYCNEDVKKCEEILSQQQSASNYICSDNCPFAFPVPSEDPLTFKGGYDGDTGQDIIGKYGSDIIAAASGKIIYSEHGHTDWCSDSGNYVPGDTCNSILIELDKPYKHSDGKTYYYTWYTHMSTLAFSIPDGSTPKHVDKGTVLGKMGNGNKVPHLHFGIVTDRAQVGPGIDCMTHTDIRKIFKDCQSKCTATTGGTGNMCFPLTVNQNKQDTLALVTPGSGRYFKDYRTGRFHAGNDLLAPPLSDISKCPGTGARYPVRAIESGTVVILTHGFACGKDYVMIKNDSDGKLNGYGEVISKVSQGQHVNGGETIAEIDDIPGCCMLHFERPKKIDAKSDNPNDFDDPNPYLQKTSDNCSQTTETNSACTNATQKITALPKSTDNSYTSYSSADRQNGREDVICKIQNAAKTWKQKHSDKKLEIGDINAPGHLSHQNGIDADIFIQTVTDIKSPQYNRNEAIELLHIFEDNGFAVIFDDVNVINQAKKLNDPRYKPFMYSSCDSSIGTYGTYCNHPDHFHIRYIG